MNKIENGNGNGQVASQLNWRYFLYPFTIIQKASKYKILLLRPTCIALSFFVLWECISWMFIFKPKDDQELQILLLAFEVFGTVVVALHGFLATLFLIKLFERDHNISMALEFEDEKLFRMSTYSMKDSLLFHGLLFLYSIVFFIGFLVFPFPNNSEAFFFIFATMFLIFLIWEVALELLDPYEGVSRIDKEKVKFVFGDDYFERKYKAKKRKKKKVKAYP